jgi:NAD(P)-dependent dehydrogenase (short-subunit alcohol dehydrogenase family)
VSGPNGVTEDELRHCIDILERLLVDPGALALAPESLRIGLLTAAGRLVRPDAAERMRQTRAYRSQLQQRRQDRDRRLRATAGIRIARAAPAFVAPPQIAARSDSANPPGEPVEEFLRSNQCYVCKADYQELHFFYDTMCPRCALFNYQKRFQSARLDGRVVLVTGGRVKIGFQIALKVLRAGAHVVVTTRFPRDAAVRFLAESDSSDWKDRLEIHGLDLRHAPSVELFADHLGRTLPRLDIMIHNACQTVRRPPEYFTHLLDFETQQLDNIPPEVAKLIHRHEACKRELRERNLPLSSDTGRASGELTVAGEIPRAAPGLFESARASQLVLGEDHSPFRNGLFPAGQYDSDLQQVDMRLMNSWRLKLAEVPTYELLEVHLVNAIAPFVLCARLKPLMMRDRTDEKHVVNVSAMEGKFCRPNKTDRHPHTNMAKAALNMMTRTAAQDYVKDGIFMNSVDTGWVTDEDPVQHATRKRDELDFQPPLDIVDGAARVCDPFFSGLITGVHPWGVFFKDYAPTEW